MDLTPLVSGAGLWSILPPLLAILLALLNASIVFAILWLLYRKKVFLKV